MESKPISRRAALGVMAASAATLAGCGSNEEKMVTPPPSSTAGQNMFDALSQHHFIGQDGEPVNINALKASLKDKQTTLTFGFAECTDYCPMINNVLGALGQKNPDLVSIQINVSPEENGKTDESRAAVLQTMRAAGVKHDTIILYPTDANGKLSNAVVPTIAHSLGTIVNKSDPLNHSSYIKLNAPGGNEITKKTGTDPLSEFKEEWTPLLNSRKR
jgi:cytochrome oxidase Cu insertion factor (SCO1/SenC/PrrC family)